MLNTPIKFTSGYIVGLQGMMLATVISYVNWHSILWAILHGIFSWFYVIYFVIMYN
jgi:hypothetical protein